MATGYDWLEIILDDEKTQSLKPRLCPVSRISLRYLDYGYLTKGMAQEFLLNANVGAGMGGLVGVCFILLFLPILSPRNLKLVMCVVLHSFPASYNIQLRAMSTVLTACDTITHDPQTWQGAGSG